MGLGSGRNRRRTDARERAEHVRGAIARRGGKLARAAGVLVAAVGAVALVSWGWIWCRSSPWFAVESVSFSGLHRASEAELLLLAGIAPGQNVFAIDAAVAERAMASHPWVRAATVKRHPPSGISVEIEEHAPYAMVALASLYLVDRDGTAFRKVEPGDKLDLPLVTGLDRDSYERDAAGTTARVCAALDVAEAYGRSPEGKRARLSEVRLEAGGGVALVVGRDGVEVRLGEGDVEQKLARLAKVRAELEARSMRAETIHLDNRARPGWVAIKVSGR
jgi:cell division protein FtsQ